MKTRQRPQSSSPPPTYPLGFILPGEAFAALLSRSSYFKGERRGERDCEVVQYNGGLWVHRAGVGSGKDGFVHIAAVEKVGVDLREGDKVTYDVVPSKGKESAENLRVK
jgi:cold shock CspA family protein